MSYICSVFFGTLKIFIAHLSLSNHHLGTENEQIQTRGSCAIGADFSIRVWGLW